MVGAQTWDELHRRENDLVEARALELLTRLVPQTFDLDHLRALHGHLFQDVYPWAGEIRTVDMGKRAGRGFLPHGQVPEVMEHVRDVLRDVKWLRTSSLPTAKRTLPLLYNIVNTAHPFREGNGRTQRQFFNDLAKGAGFKIDWTSIPKAVKRSRVRDGAWRRRAAYEGDVRRDRVGDPGAGRAQRRSGGFHSSR